MPTPNKSNLKSKKVPLSRRTRAILWGIFLYATGFAACIAIAVYGGVAFTGLMVLELAAAVLPVFFVGTLVSFGFIKKVTLASLIENLENKDGSFEKNFNRFIHQSNANQILCSEKYGPAIYNADRLMQYLYLKDKNNFEKYSLELINLIEPGEASQGVIDALFELQPILNNNIIIIQALLGKNVSEQEKSEALVSALKNKDFKMVALLKEYGATYNNLEFKEKAESEAKFEIWKQAQPNQVKAKQPEPILQKKSKKTAKSVASAQLAEPLLEKIKCRKKAK